jgi:hypothetical protein
MNYIKDINSFINEAISMKMYKENLPKELWYDKSDGYKNWDKLFGEGVNRISIPLKSSRIILPETTPLMEEINSIFIPLGYKINSFEDYLNNKVYKIGDTKNPMKIGGLLNKVDVGLFKKYDVDTERKQWRDMINNSDKPLKIIISRHPYDLLGMSSGRDWRLSSCMRLGTKDDKVYRDVLGFSNKEDYETKNVYGVYYDWVETEGGNKDSIVYDIEEGVLVAYVVNVNDNNINKPLSRLLIKPYVNKRKDDDIVWISSDTIYGETVEGFKSSVDVWLDSWQKNNFNGIYCIKRFLYSDRKNNVIKISDISKFYKDFLNQVCKKSSGMSGKWEINSNGEVDVDGDVDMSGLDLTEIPIKFGEVDGDFNCSNNNLTTLKNCPTYVGGYFDCSSNKLESMLHSPSYVWKYIDCSWNNLKSLEFSNPSKNQTYLKSFSCHNNKITSLEGIPKSRKYIISNNNLTTLLGFSLDKVIEDFDCSGNYLTSLEFAPTSVGWNFRCGFNNLTSLEFAPTSVGWNFYCYKQRNGYTFTENDIREISKVYKDVIVK